MPRPEPSAFSGELGLDNRPFWVLEIGFSTPLRVCGRQAMTIGGDAFQHEDLEVDLPSRSVQIFNAGLALTNTFWTEDTARVPVKLWRGYGVGDTWAYTDLQLRIDGLMGGLSVGVDVGFQIRPESPRETPGLSIGDVVPEEHLIPDGAIADTRSGKVKLTST